MVLGPGDSGMWAIGVGAIAVGASGVGARGMRTPRFWAGGGG